MNNKNKRHYAVVVGARPNFVKAAPFFRRAKDYPHLKFTLIHTGQHFDPEMSQVFFEEMEIPKPDVHLNIKDGKHSERIGKMSSEIKKVLRSKNFDGCIVFGDVNSTMVATIAALSSACPVIHIEAGLRSHDRRMQEEANRLIVDHLSSLLFTTEKSADENLRLEGIEAKKIKSVGNIMIESLEVFKDKIDSSKILEKLDIEPRKYVLATIHRQENIGDEENFKKTFDLLKEVSKVTPVIFSLHPHTKKNMENKGFLDGAKGVKIIDPIGYFDFGKLMKESRGVLTDSGGIQEETTHLGIPCCTLRDNTERPITLEMGSNKLFPIREASADNIASHIKRADFKSRHIPLWDDKVSERIFEHL